MGRTWMEIIREEGCKSLLQGEDKGWTFMSANHDHTSQETSVGLEEILEVLGIRISSTSSRPATFDTFVFCTLRSVRLFLVSAHYIQALQQSHHIYIHHALLSPHTPSIVTKKVCWTYHGPYAAIPQPHLFWAFLPFSITPKNSPR